MSTTLVYNVFARINPGVVVTNDTVLSLNSAFDPEVSGVGHQPRLFDQYAALYGRYRVDRTHVMIITRQRAAHGVSVVLVPSNSATALTSADRPCEFTRAVHGGITGSSQPCIRQETAFLPHAVIGLSKAQYDDEEDCSAVTTASPAQQAYLHVVHEQVDQTTVLDVEVHILLKYDITFYDRITPGVSLMAELAALRVRVRQDEEEFEQLSRPPSPVGAAAAANAALRASARPPGAVSRFHSGR